MRKTKTALSFNLCVRVFRYSFLNFSYENQRRSSHVRHRRVSQNMNGNGGCLGTRNRKLTNTVAMCGAPKSPKKPSNTVYMCESPSCTSPTKIDVTNVHVSVLFLNLRYPIKRSYRQRMSPKYPQPKHMCISKILLLRRHGKKT